MKKYNFNVGTKFQKMVWNGIANIPKGNVLTYQELAKEIGHQKVLEPLQVLVVKILHSGNTMS